MNKSDIERMLNDRGISATVACGSSGEGAVLTVRIRDDRGEFTEHEYHGETVDEAMQRASSDILRGILDKELPEVPKLEGCTGRRATCERAIQGLTPICNPCRRI